MFWWVPILVLSLGAGRAAAGHFPPGFDFLPWLAVALLWESRRLKSRALLLAVLAAWAGRPLATLIFSWPGWNVIPDWDWPGLVLALGVWLAGLPLPGLEIPAYAPRTWGDALFAQLAPLALVGALYNRHPLLAAAGIVAAAWICGRTAAHGQHLVIAGASNILVGAAALCGFSPWLDSGGPWAAVLHTGLPAAAVGFWTWRVSRLAAVSAEVAALEKELAKVGLDVPAGGKKWRCC